MTLPQLPDELIQGIVLLSGGSWGDAAPEDRQFFRNFAALVAAYEREECAKFCEEQYMFYGYDHVFADGIRARGEK